MCSLGILSDLGKTPKATHPKLLRSVPSDQIPPYPHTPPTHTGPPAYEDCLLPTKVFSHRWGAAPGETGETGGESEASN